MCRTTRCSPDRPTEGHALRIKPRTFLAHRAVRLAEKWLDRTLLPIDFPPAREGPRYGFGRPPHARLKAILGRDHAAYSRSLESVRAYRADLARIELHAAAPADPFWFNKWLPSLDAAALYAFLRDRDPRLYIEVGSGMSTLFARRAVDDGHLRTRICSIDPAPREPAARRAAHETVDQPLEVADLSLFDALGPGDVVFLDGSHRVLTQSDATVFLLEVLPDLPDGVLVGVHDILWPDDYLPEWTEYHWSEQYLVAAHLLAEGHNTRLELAAHYAGRHADLTGVLDPLWDEIALPADARRGFGLWLTTTNRA